MKICIVEKAPTGQMLFGCDGPLPSGACSRAGDGRPPCAGKQALTRSVDGSVRAWQVSADAEGCFIRSTGASALTA